MIHIFSCVFMKICKNDSLQNHPLFLNMFIKMNILNCREKFKGWEYVGILGL